MRKTKWTKAQRARYTATIRARRKRKAGTRLAEWGRELQRDEISKSLVEETFQVYRVEDGCLCPVNFRLVTIKVIE
jgi:hypothetical protein